uniref:BZIP domain-containing protein n=1 Tax=Rhabditophanes sp. KR3021 TaxID=114890 RepID=A0AC35TK96_9BILA
MDVLDSATDALNNLDKTTCFENKVKGQFIDKEDTTTGIIQHQNSIETKAREVVVVSSLAHPLQVTAPFLQHPPSVPKKVVVASSMTRQHKVTTPLQHCPIQIHINGYDIASTVNSQISFTSSAQREHNECCNFDRRTYLELKEISDMSGYYEKKVKRSKLPRSRRDVAIKRKWSKTPK